MTEKSVIEKVEIEWKTDRYKKRFAWTTRHPPPPLNPQIIVSKKRDFFAKRHN